MEKLLTVKEVAEILQLSKYAIYQMVANDSIPHIKIGATNRSVRFDKEKIEKWINKKSHRYN
jgi:excisionase family DNA binding protein